MRKLDEAQGNPMEIACLVNSSCELVKNRPAELTRARNQAELAEPCKLNEAEHCLRRSRTAEHFPAGIWDATNFCRALKDLG